MERLTHPMVCLIGLLALLLPLPACAGPVTYSADPIEAWVVDAQTQQPVEGAVVVAHWVLEGGIHVDRVGDLVIMEAVTDKNGRFYFPAWGPIRHWKRSRLTYMDPEILIFKSGYKYQRLTNDPTPEALGGKAFPVRKSKWHGKTIKLEKFKGSNEKYAEHLKFLNNSLYPVYRSENCDWKKIPRMLHALTKQSRSFRSQGINALYDAYVHLPVSVRKCGLAKKYLESINP